MADPPKQKHLAAAGQPMATYPERQGNRVQLYQLGCGDRAGSKGAFNDLAQAINGATKFIFICDWSFQPYVRLAPRTAGPAIAQTAGALLNAKAKAGVLVAIHVWNHVQKAAYDDWNNSGGKWLDEIAKQVSGGKEQARNANLLWRSSSRTGLGYSFHQKYVILDADDAVTGKKVIKVFFGGLDITKGRFDWGEHPILDNVGVEPWVSVNNGKRAIDDWYNAEFTTNKEPGKAGLPRQPWQDYYANIIGPASWDLAREFVGRWNSDNGSIGKGTSGDTSDQAKERVETLFKGLSSDGAFAKEWDAYQGPFVARVVRSIESVDWTQRVVKHLLKSNETKNCDTATADNKTQTEFIWRIGGRTFEKSIEESYVNAIQNAKRFVYIETQYFIGSGDGWSHGGVKNRIPRAIADKICDKIDAGEDFHAYIIIPMFPEGDPTSGAEPDQRQYEWNTMQFMITTVGAKASAKGKDWEDYLSFYFLANRTGGFPVTKAGAREDRVKANKRYMIYVHSKLMIIDDQFLIVGSANLNERSLAGDRDTEICVYLRPGEGKLSECQKIIGDLRKEAWTDHMGGALPPDADNPEKTSCSAAFRAKGRANWAAFAMNTPGAPADKTHLVKFPFKLATDGKSMYVEVTAADPEIRFQEMYIFDAEAAALSPPKNGTRIDDVWFWHCPHGGNTPAYLAE